MYKSEELSYLNRMVITVYVNLSSSHDGGLDTLTTVIVDAVVVGHLRQLQRSVHLPLHAVSVHLLLQQEFDLPVQEQSGIKLQKLISDKSFETLNRCLNNLHSSLAVICPPINKPQEDIQQAEEGMFVLVLLNVFMKNMETLFNLFKLEIVYMCTAKLLITKQGLANFFETVEAFLNSKMNTNNTEIHRFRPCLNR